MICTLQRILFGWSSQAEWHGLGMPHVWETGKVHTGVLSGDIGGKDHLEDLDVEGKIILSLIFKKWDTETWTGSWVLPKCGALLDLTEDMLPTQEGPYSLEFVSYLISLFVSKVVGWIVGCLFVWLVGWLVGWLAGWLVGWLVGCLVGWSVSS